MRRQLIRVLPLILGVVVILSASLQARTASAQTGAACYSGQWGQSIDCGGGYVTPTPVTHSAPAHGHTGTVVQVPLAWFVANGPTGPCMALGPANPTPNAAILEWQRTAHLPQCTGPPRAPARPNPAALAVSFWQTIPLPVPRPEVPPGYAICGKYAYLVTHGTTTPATYTENTPLGPLTITARGSYLVNWGDPYAPGWSGPYPYEGQPYPNGNIPHVYDYAGTYTVIVREQWNATWRLGGAAGALGGLQTTGTINGFKAVQYEPVLNN